MSDQRTMVTELQELRGRRLNWAFHPMQAQFACGRAELSVRSRPR